MQGFLRILEPFGSILGQPPPHPRGRARPAWPGKQGARGRRTLKPREVLRSLAKLAPLGPSLPSALTPSLPSAIYDLLERGGDASPARTGSEQGLFLAVWWGCVCRRGRGGAVPKKPVPSLSVCPSHSRMAPKAPRIPKIPLYSRENANLEILR